MGDIFDARGNGGGEPLFPLPSAADYEQYPRCSKLLVGVYSDDRKTWTLPSHSLIVWLEGSLLKFLFNPVVAERRLFGSSSGLTHGLQGIEAALANGNCDWKPPKPKR